MRLWDVAPSGLLPLPPQYVFDFQARMNNEILSAGLDCRLRSGYPVYFILTDGGWQLEVGQAEYEAARRAAADAEIKQNTPDWF